MGKEALAQLAGRQHGLFVTAQAFELGLTVRQIQHGDRTGRWSRLHRGVYRITGAPATDLQRLLAAVLGHGPAAVASHRGAAWLWGMAEDLHLDLSSPRHGPPVPGVMAYRRPAADLRRVVRRGIPCTDPLRTVADLAALGERGILEIALDRGIAGGLFSVGAIRAELERRAGKGRRGVGLLRACVTERLDDDGGRTSCLESPMDRLIVRQRLPLPERQFWLPNTRYRLDYAWPSAKLAVEVDGYESHAGLDAFRSERARQNVLVLLGWTVLRFTSDDVRRRAPVVAEQIRAATRAGTAPTGFLASPHA
ncbi:MAG TPA: type IV toxin-antitoxin system AbiEi family antitoxin domain-containing protein [Acidimicrobiales bacterium]|nr:type IV toxin-antitoxin system AbiEi family antitoxin domain-containing protein [Acidimicrobiales bacterium]